jgi:hypothetical protein
MPLISSRISIFSRYVFYELLDEERWRYQVRYRTRRWLRSDVIHVGMILSGKGHANASRYFYSGNQKNVKRYLRAFSSLRTDSIREQQAGLRPVNSTADERGERQFLRWVLKNTPYFLLTYKQDGGY